MQSVSVIMPTFNKADYLEITLMSFQNQSFKNFELVIVDDGSTDKTKEIIAKFKGSLNLKYVFQKNQGRGKSRNKALSIATGDLIIFNDDDRVVPANYIKTHVEHLEKGGKNTVVIGWKHNILTIWDYKIKFDQMELFDLLRKNDYIMNLLNNNINDNAAKIINDADLRTFDEKKLKKFIVNNGKDNFSDLFETYGSQLKDFNFKWFLGTTANMSLYKDFIFEAGVFDENFNGWGMEDTDLSYRLAMNNASFVFSKNTYNFHQYHPTNANKSKELRENTFYFAHKYKSLEAILFLRCYLNLLTLRDANEILELSYRENSLYNEFHSLYKNSLELYK